MSSSTCRMVRECKGHEAVVQDLLARSRRARLLVELRIGPSQICRQGALNSTCLLWYCR